VYEQSYLNDLVLKILGVDFEYVCTDLCVNRPDYPDYVGLQFS